jgi:predicted transcriptional regulator YheO
MNRRTLPAVTNLAATSLAQRENALLLREGRKIVEALGAMFTPLVEVVLHDLTRPDHAVVAIANNLSGRGIGAPATELGLVRIADTAFPEVLQNYPNRFPDGRHAKSTSIGLKNSEGDYVAAICLNMDIGLLGGVAAQMQTLISTGAANAQATVNESLDGTVSNNPTTLRAVRAQLEQFATARNATPRSLNKSQKREAVQTLVQLGLMNLKNAPTEAAHTLGIARSTIYTYLPQ